MSRIIVFFLVIMLIGISILLIALTGYNAVYVLAILLMIVGFIFLLFRARIGIAILISSTVLLLIINGLKRTISEDGSILDSTTDVGRYSFPMGYLILTGVILILGKVLIGSIRRNSR